MLGAGDPLLAQRWRHVRFNMNKLALPRAFTVLSMALAKGAEMSDFNQAVLRCGSILAIKLGALNLLTVRSRMIKNDFTTGRPSKQVGRQTVERSTH